MIERLIKILKTRKQEISVSWIFVPDIWKGVLYDQTDSKVAQYVYKRWYKTAN